MLFTCVSFAEAQQASQDNGGRRTITAVRLLDGESITLDGRIDEPFWSRAVPAADFIQIDPANGTPATEQTEVRIAFNRGALYLGVTCLDSEPDRWIGWQLARDGPLSSDDGFMWTIDTFLDGRTGYFFEMNPSGLMADALTGGRRRPPTRCRDTGTAIRSRSAVFSEVPFPVAKDIGGDYSLAVTDQRHRAVFNSIWQVGGGFQLSGVYFYGSGERHPRYYEEDLRGLGEGFEAFSFRLREDGSIVPRNGFSGDPVHRVDIRLQQRIPLGGRISIDGIAEIFNLFDRANFGTYVTDELSPLFGQPEFNSNLAYAARTLQLGFRLTF